MKIMQLSFQFSLKDQIRNFSGMLLFLLFVFLLAACGGSDTGGSSATVDTTVPEACTLLSAADTEPVLGSSVSSAGTVAEDGLRSNCTWQDEISGATLMLSIWAAGDAGDGWASQFLSAQVAGGENVPVENLGEEAYAIDNENFSNYYWRVDDAFVVVMISTANEASQDALLEIARKIDNGF